ncbi:MAG: hypothetical protein NTW59_00630 [Candidatus Diapherotrites archaeon]|nr:hypothetical protein [Candidatus Diapherotrites archaeon]
MVRRARPTPDGKIEKAEDKAWQEWFKKLDAKGHEEYLSKLGLDKEEIGEWEEAERFKKPAKKKE